MTAITIAAIRVVAAMPITARANWIFRITELRPVPKFMAAVRNTMLLLTVLPACAVSTAYLAYRVFPLSGGKTSCNAESVRSAPRRVEPVRFPENPVHVFLSAWKGEPTVCFLDLGFSSPSPSWRSCALQRHARSTTHLAIGE